ncbi:chromate transporter [Acholeplasma granularum]|uniref:chromate transporter n=1 Tax=Acholeplasma granularum TaxID=264635 RepID=UPI0004728A33|nr:chromate transporter [Acholeplasma granularum]
MVFELIRLFFIFFKIGLFTFGGGYAMIPLIRTEVVQNHYLTIIQVDQFIGIAESTPGPFAINIATFVGYNTHGLLGSVFATLGVVLPSFIIILLIAYFSAKILTTKAAKMALAWINPLTIGLILSAGISVFIQANFGGMDGLFKFDADYIGIVIFAVVLLASVVFKKINPIFLIIIAGVLGLIGYSIF